MRVRQMPRARFFGRRRAVFVTVHPTDDGNAERMSQLGRVVYQRESRNDYFRARAFHFRAQLCRVAEIIHVDMPARERKGRARRVEIKTFMSALARQPPQ